VSEERDDRGEPGGLTPGDPLGEPPPPPPEPPPLPEQPLGPPSMADDPPPLEGPPPGAAQPLPPPPAYTPPPPAYTPPQSPPAQAPPAGGWAPPTAPGQPPAYPPPQQQPTYPPPPAYQPRPARPRGPHGQPIWDNGVELSGWGARAGAFLLDWLFVSLAPLLSIGFFVANTTATNIIGGLLLGVGLLFASLVYAPVFMARGGVHNGQTPGKQIVGIRVVRDNGEAYDFWNAFMREFLVRQLLFGVVGTFFFGLAYLLDYLWPLWDETNRALHDMIVNSHVVRADPPLGGGPSPTGLPG
jgi:uncharacterized RDD family membrane protein YckC